MDYQPILLGATVLNTAALGYMLWQRNSEQQKIKNQMVVDTSGLIDGRIVDIVGSGFVPPRLVIPQFVVAELQFLADQGDAYKRERARYGLEVVRRLQDMRQTEVVIKPGMARGIKEVDDKLVALAKKTGAMLYTTDFNLNQVAQIEGVRVLNVNELAQGLRAMHLPGEKRDIKITQIGQDRTQGVGYLEDGTMVVVEQAAKKLNQHVQVEFTRMLQTQAGKMMFATLVGAHKHDNNHVTGNGGNVASGKKQNAQKVQPAEPMQMQSVPKQTPVTPKQEKPVVTVAAEPKQPMVYHSDANQQSQAQNGQRPGGANKRRRNSRMPRPAQQSQPDDGHVKL
jgi:rRNA-processing protein FCF1